MKQAVSALILTSFVIAAPAAFGHGFAGKRFFPATLNVEDSFVAPEMDFLYTHHREDGVYATEWETEFAKPLTDDFQLSFGASYVQLDPPVGSSESGFDNIEVGAKYQVFIDAAAESALAVGVDAEVGGTGNRNVGAESFSVISPAVYYSKGFGDVSVGWLRPFAITAAIAPAFPTDNTAPDTLEWGFTLQYSLPYLEDFVKDVGLPGPILRNMIPVVEFPMETCLEGACNGKTTGSVNPGFVWIGKYAQLGLEAVIPVNDGSDDSQVGVQLQFHLYLDDIIPSWSVRRS